VETLTEVGAISLTEVYCRVLGIEAGTITPTPVFIAKYIYKLNKGFVFVNKSLVK
jgi:hypothetical protein